MDRFVVLKNRTRKPILIREELQNAIPGSYNRTLVIGPESEIQISADMFNARNRNSMRGAAIHLFVAEFQVNGRFTPAFFTDYVKVVFDLYENLEEGGVGSIIVRGVTPKWTDLGRFWGLGFFGRNYEGRDGNILATWELKIPEED